MNKEFVYDIDSNQYLKIDNNTGKIEEVNKYGESRIKFKEYYSGIVSGKQRNQIVMQNNKTDLYTPHQNKFYGYFQFPMGKLNEMQSEESRQQSRQSRYSQRRTQHVKNCYNQPPELITFEKQLQEMPLNESSFIPVGQHLTGTINECVKAMKDRRIERFSHRKETKYQRLNQNLTARTGQFVCKVINQKQIMSPQPKIIERLRQKSKIIKPTNCSEMRVENRDETQSYIQGNYLTLDLSLRSDSVDCTKIRENQKLKENKQIYSFNGTERCENSQDATNLTENLITCRDLQQKNEQYGMECNSYPIPKTNKFQGHPRVKNQKINTEFELYLKYKDDFIEF